MAKVNGLSQDAEEEAFDRYTNIVVEADVEMMFHCGKIESFRITHVGANYNFDWMSIKSWSGSPIKVDTNESIN